VYDGCNAGLHNKKVECIEDSLFILTPWSVLFAEKLIVTQGVKKFRALCGTQMFITVPTKALLVHFLNQANPVHLLTPVLIKINFNIILPYTPRSYT
jgi:hypothetical protein